MAGLPWIKVWTRVTGHPKVQRLERELGVRDALGIVVRLWCWTADYAPGGTVSEGEALTAARAARGDATKASPSTVLDALREAGLIDRTPDGYRVHDWDEMQVRHLEAEEKRRAQARERQAAYRARHGITTKVTPNGMRNVTRDVTRDSVTEIEREIKTEASDQVVSLNSRSFSPPLGGAGGTT
jgi:hypothetical protein